MRNRALSEVVMAPVQVGSSKKEAYPGRIGKSAGSGFPQNQGTLIQITRAQSSREIVFTPDVQVRRGREDLKRLLSASSGDSKKGFPYTLEITAGSRTYVFGTASENDYKGWRAAMEFN